MDKTDKLYSGFIVLALLAWNPVSFRLLYHDCWLRENKLLLIFFSICSVLAVVALVKIKGKMLSLRSRNIAFSISFFGLLFLVFVLADKTLGRISARNKKATITDHINSSAHYKTPEYEFTARLNSLGIRDQEPDLKKTKYRILCIGDSWTYGWGVGAEQAWPKMLERLLKDKSVEAEVINAGFPGTYPDVYLQVLKRSLPILQPDMVLIGINQHDDLSQLYEYNCLLPDNLQQPYDAMSVSENLYYAVTEFIKSSFKNTRTFFQKKDLDAKALQEVWKWEVNSILRQAGLPQRMRYHALPDSLKQLFESGNCNPGTLYYDLYFPERKFIFNNPQNPATVFAADRMKKDLEAMKELCAQYQSRLVFVNLPNAEFTGHQADRLPELAAYHSDLETHNRIDPLYRDMTQALEIPYIELTGRFRSLTNKTDYFFRYDNHPTPIGHAAMAAGIADTLPAIIGK